MWIVGLLVLFIVVLILSTRKTENYYNSTTPAVTSTSLPVLVENGIPYAVLKDGSVARISFAQRGISVRDANSLGVQDLSLGGGLPLKIPVRLARGGEDPVIGVLRHRDSSVRSVVVDMGTRQLHFRNDRVLQDGEGTPYTLTTEGVELRGESSRLGNISLNLDDIQSVGYAGRVTVDGTTMRVRKTAPGYKTSIGSHDITEGKHRLIFDVVDSRVLVQ